MTEREVSDMASFFLCKIICVLKVIMVLNVLFFILILSLPPSLLLRDIDTREKETWPWTPPNIPLPWVLIITVSGYADHYHHNTELPGNVFNTAFNSYTWEQKDNYQGPIAAVLLEARILLCNFLKNWSVHNTQREKVIRCVWWELSGRNCCEYWIGRIVVKSICGPDRVLRSLLAVWELNKKETTLYD